MHSSGTHPKKLFIKGLPSIHTEAEVELRRAQLERAFFANMVGIAA
jgi:hypothetical protein